MTNKQILQQLNIHEATLSVLSQELKNHHIAVLRLIKEIEG